MMQALQVAALVLVAIAWTFALSHAAELPGKLRLDRDAYLAVQRIYYPGFTLGGASEPLAILALAGLLTVTPAGSVAFVWTAAALAAATAMHAVFWIVTQPVNRVWAKIQEMGAAGTAFFATGGGADETDWTKLRDRWERSHVARAILMGIAFLCLAMAVTSGPGVG